MWEAFEINRIKPCVNKGESDSHYVNAVFLEFPFNRRIHILYKVFSNVFWSCHCNGWFSYIIKFWSVKKQKWQLKFYVISCSVVWLDLTDSGLAAVNLQLRLHEITNWHLFASKLLEKNIYLIKMGLYRIFVSYSSFILMERKMISTKKFK